MRLSLRGLESWLKLLQTAFAATCVFAAHSPVHATRQVAELPGELKRQIEAVLKKSQVRGAAVVLVDTSGPVGAAWIGTADVARGVAVSGSTCMSVGGLANTFTSVLAMRLSEQNKLELEAALPADLQPAAPAQCAARVNLAQLLEQTAGVTGAALTGGTKRVLSWCPGLHFRASEDSFALAAEVLSRAGGSDFGTLMRREVFVPLNMHQTALATGPGSASAPACLSRSYATDGSEIQSALNKRESVKPAIISTPLELASLVQMLLRYGEGPAGNVLEPCSMAHLASGSTSLASRLGASASTEGRGLKRLLAAGRLMVGYTGQADGFHSVIGLAPEQGRGMVIVLNTDDRMTLTRLQDLAATWVWQEAEAAHLPGRVAAAQSIDGWYAKAPDDNTPQARWRAARELVRVEATQNGALLRAVWPWADAREVRAVTSRSFRSQSLPLAGMAFTDLPDGSRWWIDGESHAEISPFLAVSTLAAPLAMGLVLVLLSCALIFWFLRRGRVGR